jgi:hypothetical protein
MKFTIPSWLKFTRRRDASDLTERLALPRLQPAGRPNKRDPWGCMAGTVKIFPETDLTEPTGEKWKAEDGQFL